MNIGLILVAAGYGSLRSCGNAPVPKVLEEVGGLPLLIWPLLRAIDAGVRDVVIVTNPLSRAAITVQVAEALGPRTACVQFAVQPDRLGAADAVLRAVPLARSRRLTRALIAYGDMPLWSSETMYRLMRASVERGNIVTLATAERGAGLAALDSYGRVVRDEYGMIERIIEPNDPRVTPNELALQTVNPSLWVWDLEWIAQNVEHVVPFKRPDGAPERHMPPLVALASQTGGVIEYPLPAHARCEALGVNTLEELAVVRDRFA